MQTLTTMKSLTVTGPGVAEFLETERPPVGPRDVAVKIKACGICGSDVFYVQRGGIPPRDSHTPLGHEPAGEIVEVGAEVQGAAVGDHVVINPMANRDGIIGNGGAQGALSDEVVLFDAEGGRALPGDPRRGAVGGRRAQRADGRGVPRRQSLRRGRRLEGRRLRRGPVGLGAAIGFKSKGAAHVVVVDIQPSRLERALLIGADAVINSAEEDVAERLKELHGEVPGFMGRGSKAATDVYFDAAGAPVVIETALKAMRNRGVLTIVAVHKKPVELDLQELLTTEPDIRLAMGYPTEIFEVTDSIIEHWDKYQHIISDIVPFAEAERAMTLASTPGAADKVVVIFD